MLLIDHRSQPGKNKIDDDYGDEEEEEDNAGENHDDVEEKEEEEEEVEVPGDYYSYEDGEGEEEEDSGKVHLKIWVLLVTNEHTLLEGTVQYVSPSSFPPRLRNEKKSDNPPP